MERGDLIEEEVHTHKSEEGIRTNLMKGGHTNQIVDCSKRNTKQFRNENISYAIHMLILVQNFKDKVSLWLKGDLLWCFGSASENLSSFP